MSALLAKLVRLVDDDTGEAIKYLVQCHSAEQALRALAAANATLPLLEAEPAHSLPTALPVEETRRRGRPSYAVVLAQAVEQLDLDPRLPLAVRARAVMRHLAETGAEIPATRTVETFLAEHGSVRKKERRKSRRKKLSSTITIPTEDRNAEQDPEVSERPQRRARNGR